MPPYRNGRDTSLLLGEGGHPGSFMVYTETSGDGVCCRLLVSSAASFGHMKQKETQGNRCHVIPWVLRSQAGLPSSLHHSGSFYIWFTNNVQRF